MKILIVDDEKLIQQTLSHVAQVRGHSCASAGNEQEGLKVWRCFQPDLVFLDLVLPDGNGFSLMEQAPRSSVVLMSAYEQFKEKALEKGAFLFLTKPFENIFHTFDDVILRLNSQNRLAEL